MNHRACITPWSGLDKATLFFSMLGGFLSYPAFSAVFGLCLGAADYRGGMVWVEFAQV